jgi:hypothetical protein
MSNSSPSYVDRSDYVTMVVMSYLGVVMAACFTVTIIYIIYRRGCCCCSYASLDGMMLFWSFMANPSVRGMLYVQCFKVHNMRVANTDESMIV